MTLELIFGVEMGFPLYAKVESFCLLAAMMMMMMRSVCVALDPAAKISLSLTIFEALVKNPKRGKKKKKKRRKIQISLVCLLVFTVAKEKKKKFREREREKLLRT